MSPFRWKFDIIFFIGMPNEAKCPQKLPFLSEPNWQKMDICGGTKSKLPHLSAVNINKQVRMYETNHLLGEHQH